MAQNSAPISWQVSGKRKKCSVKNATINLAPGKFACSPQTAKHQVCFVLLLLVIIGQSYDLTATAAPSPDSRPRTGEQDSSMEFSPLANSIDTIPFGARQWYFAGGASGASAATNSKRARKMSAFMPMRGRRAGPFSSDVWAWPGPENDDNTGLHETSVLSLAAAGQPHVSMSGGPARLVLFQPNGFVLQHLQRTRGTAAQTQREQEPAENGGNDGSSLQLMEAKPRRAFHPMRGKKSQLEFPENDQLMAEQLDGEQILGQI